MTTTEVADCPICTDPLTGPAFGTTAPNGIITLPCHATHRFHGNCLYGAAWTAANNPTDTGATIGGQTVWRVMPPRCPTCRARFTGATYWANLATADLYPDQGYEYTAAPPQGNNVTAMNIDDDDDDTGTDTDDAPMVHNNQMADSDSDDEIEEGSRVGTMQCTIDGGTQDLLEYTAAYFLDNIAAADNTNCYICGNAINRTDPNTVVVCAGACGRVSHWHDS